MIKITWRIISALILILLIYAVIDDGLYLRVINNPENKWILKMHQEYLRSDHFDKYGHFFMSGLIALFLNILLSSKMIRIGGVTFLLGNIIVGVGFTLMEIYHFFIPSRNFELLDLFFTYAGIFIIGRLGIWIVKGKQIFTRTHTT